MALKFIAFYSLLAITNAGVIPSITTTYAVPHQPVLSKPVYTQATAPIVYSHAVPAVAKTISYGAPIVTKTALAPAPALYTHVVPSVPKTVSYAAPVAVNHGPAATTYTHDAHGVSGYGSSQTIHYSPAELVSHMSFDGFGTHWGF